MRVVEVKAAARAAAARAAATEAVVRAEEEMVAVEMAEVRVVVVTAAVTAAVVRAAATGRSRARKRRRCTGPSSPARAASGSAHQAQTAAKRALNTERERMLLGMFLGEIS